MTPVSWAVHWRHPFTKLAGPAGVITGGAAQQRRRTCALPEDWQLTLLTATRQPEISETAVLARVLRT